MANMAAETAAPAGSVPSRALPRGAWRPFAILLLGLAVLAAAGYASLMFGAVRLSPGEVWSGLTSPEDVFARNVVWQIRYPRLLDAMIVGAGLAVAGKNITAVAILSDRDQTLYAAKSTSSTGDILKELGIKYPADALPDAGPFPGYATIAPEKMIEFNPDYIFAITPAPPPAPRLASLIPTIPPFRGLKAVTSNHVIDADVELFVQAPGPRVKLALDAVAKAVGGQ